MSPFVSSLEIYKIILLKAVRFSQRLLFRLNINCDFIYSWQEVDSRRPRIRSMAVACKCIDELLISVLLAISIYFFVNFFTLRYVAVTPGFIKSGTRELTAM